MQLFLFWDVCNIDIKFGEQHFCPVATVYTVHQVWWCKNTHYFASVVALVGVLSKYTTAICP